MGICEQTAIHEAFINCSGSHSTQRQNETNGERTVRRERRRRSSPRIPARRPQRKTRRHFSVPPPAIPAKLLSFAYARSRCGAVPRSRFSDETPTVLGHAVGGECSENPYDEDEKRIEGSLDCRVGIPVAGGTCTRKGFIHQKHWRFSALDSKTVRSCVACYTAGRRVEQ